MARPLYRGADLRDLRRRITRLREAIWLMRFLSDPNVFMEHDLIDAIKETERVYLLMKLGVQP